ncbi:MAG: hypothetical protein ACRDSP_21340 [Pseudonocardiaceae bacterium]
MSRKAPPVTVRRALRRRADAEFSDAGRSTSRAAWWAAVARARAATGAAPARRGRRWSRAQPY